MQYRRIDNEQNTKKIDTFMHMAGYYTSILSLCAVARHVYFGFRNAESAHIKMIV